jgi:hypothetical protein
MLQITSLGSNMFLDNNLFSLDDFLESFHPKKSYGKKMVVGMFSLCNLVPLPSSASPWGIKSRAKFPRRIAHGIMFYVGSLATLS